MDRMSHRPSVRALGLAFTAVLLVACVGSAAIAGTIRKASGAIPPALIVFNSTPEAFGGQWDLWSIEPDGTNLRQLTDDEHQDWFPSLSPDRRFVAWERTPIRAASKSGNKGPVQSASTPAGEPQIFIMDLVNDKVRRLIRAPGSGRVPAFSPDGRRVAFLSDRNGPMQLWVVNVDGTGAKAISSTKALGTSRPAWGPDGEYIIFAGYPSGGDSPRLFQVGSNGKAERQLGDVEASEPAVTPDGSHLAVFSDDDIYIIDEATGEGTALQHDGPADVYQPAWSPDGRQLVFVRNALGHSELVIYEIDTGSFRPLTVQGGPRGHKSDEAPSWR